MSVHITKGHQGKKAHTLHTVLRFHVPTLNEWGKRIDPSAALKLNDCAFFRYCNETSSFLPHLFIAELSAGRCCEPCRWWFVCWHTIRSSKTSSCCLFLLSHAQTYLLCCVFCIDISFWDRVWNVYADMLYL